LVENVSQLIDDRWDAGRIQFALQAFGEHFSQELVFVHHRLSRNTLNSASFRVVADPLCHVFILFEDISRRQVVTKDCRVGVQEARDRVKEIAEAEIAPSENGLMVRIRCTQSSMICR